MVNSTSTQPEPATTPGGWTASEIQARLPKGAKAKIARRAGCHKSAVSQVIRGKSRSRKIEGFVAQVVKARRDEIFPVRIETIPEGEGASA